MNLAHFPRRRYTTKFTPIEKLERLSRHLDGPELSIERGNLLFVHTSGSPALYAYRQMVLD